MYKYKVKNGHTKASMIEALLKYNNGERATDAGKTTCKYETRDGNRCAVGCFIPEDHIGLSFVGVVRGLVQNYPDLKDSMPLGITAMSKLQRVHDDTVGQSKSLRTRLTGWVNDNTRES